MIEALGILAGIGIVWWLFIVAAFATTVVVAERELVEWLGYAVIFGSVALYFYPGVNFNVPLWLWQHLGDVFTTTIAWLAIGTVWSFWKWDRLCARARADYDEATTRRPYRAAGLPDQGPTSAADWDFYVPKVSRHKRKFGNWIVLWPQSMFWYVFSNLLVDLRDFILRQLAHVYDAIARRHFKDLPAPPAAAATNQTGRRKS